MRVPRAAALLVLLLVPQPATAQPLRPNILWLTSEDNGPHLGAYGDPFATTPNLDALARRGVRYTRVWSTAPVCAPARTALITGMYPSSLGAGHMRSMVSLPPGMALFPELLRAAGYYTTNNVKEDYNVVKSDAVWDESSSNAHWRHRPAGTPFFAVFNSTLTHESAIRARPHTAVHDPARVPIPPYHPDTPEVRQDWAQYYDQMTAMDAVMGERLRELEAAGLADDTVVFYFGDHGPGMPRGKRWLYQSGLQVPLIVYVPPKFRALAPDGYATAAAIDRLVSFVDFAPTVLSLAGVTPPEWMQGRAFMGAHAAPAQQHLFAERGRMDERYDLVRAVRDARFLYIRNYLPHRIYGQYLDYMFQTPTTRVWRRLYDEGRLQPPQTFFWQTKPVEELYDLDTDPHNVVNLAQEPAHAERRRQLALALENHLMRVRDLGLRAEFEMRASGQSPYAEARRDGYDYAALVAAAMRSSESVTGTAHLSDLRSPDADVRYWGAVHLHIQRSRPSMGGARGIPDVGTSMRPLLEDPAPAPRAVAAEYLARFGTPAERTAALASLLRDADVGRNGFYAALLALNALAHIDDLPDDARQALGRLPTSHPSIHPREREYVPRLIEAILEKRR
jgi:arylsulfatase A-like enzyme